MHVNNYSVEFGYELISCVPYAYWLHQNGQLTSTESNKGSEALYYFSPRHKINTQKREFANTHKLISAGGVPNAAIHRTFLDLDKFTPPPYKEIYANDEYKFDKHTVCICNRYNYEWGKPPINYFSLDLLDKIFNLLKDYQIVYWAADLPDMLQDQNESMSLGDREFIHSKHPEVKIFQELIEKKDWNTEQLKVFANCERFITMNGGYSILASYFGGQNIIYSKRGTPQCKEINLHSFEHWYSEFGNSQIMFVDNKEALLKKIESVYVKKTPTINVIIRTKNRKNYFDTCIKSVEAQTYDNINIIIGCEKDDKETIDYVQKYPYRVVFYHQYKGAPKPTPANKQQSFGVFFPFNHYLDILCSKIKNGYNIILDDDDCFIDNNAITQIVNEINNGGNLIFWRVHFDKNRIVPSDKNWTKQPVCKDIAMNGFCFHSKFSKKIEFGWWKRADFRVASKLWKQSKNKAFINKTLTSIQDEAHSGKTGDKKSVYTFNPFEDKSKVKCEVLSKKFGMPGQIIFVEIGSLKYLLTNNYVKKL